MEHTLLFTGNRTNGPRYRTLPLMLLIMLALSSSAWAQTILGLGTITGSNFRGEPVGAQGLVLIDATTGAALNLAPLRITGVATGQTLIGIDYRPVDNLLYALGYDASTAGANAQLYLLNAGTNVASPIGNAIRLELGGPAERIGFDFNPTVPTTAWYLLPAPLPSWTATWPTPAAAPLMRAWARQLIPTLLWVRPLPPRSTILTT
jgi:hypothetical protein